MAWLWNDEQEYKQNVDALAVNRPNSVRQTQRETWFSLQAHLHEAATELQQATRALPELHLEDPQPSDPLPIDRARELTEDIVYQGELLLLYHKRLALSDWAYDFLHTHELGLLWERYEGTKRLVHEINELITAADKLLQGYHQLQEEDERLFDDLDVPEDLMGDFTLSRNLFSIGLDDLGVFAAGRGLEGVLRAIARRRKLTYQVKGKDELLQDADFHDLSEAFARIKLVNGMPLIDKEMRSLLTFARTVRNTTAHPGKQQRRTSRQLAEVIANAEQHVWTASNGSRFAKTTLIKNW